MRTADNVFRREFAGLGSVVLKEAGVAGAA